MSDPREEELWGILQEESAEVVQAVSKRKRFGPLGRDGRNTKDLKQEIGDWLATLWLLEDEGYIDLSDIDVNMKIKLAKLELNMVHQKAPRKD